MADHACLFPYQQPYPRGSASLGTARLCPQHAALLSCSSRSSLLFGPPPLTLPTLSDTSYLGTGFLSSPLRPSFIPIVAFPERLGFAAQFKRA